MKTARWQPNYVTLHIALHYVFVVAGLIELTANETFYSFPFGAGNVILLMLLKDLDGRQLLAVNYLKSWGPFYYYPMDRIHAVSDRLWFVDKLKAETAISCADEMPVARKKLAWQGIYVRFVWGFFLFGNALAMLEIATLKTCFTFILVIPNLIQLILLKDREGEMLFHPRNLRGNFGFNWIPLKSECVVSDKLFW